MSNTTNALRLTFLGFLLLALPSTGTASATLDDPVGVNLSHIEYYTGGFATADLAKRGQEWILPGQNATLAPTNPKGWPLEPSNSRIVISGYQRFQRRGLNADDVMVLRFHEGNGAAQALTDVSAFGLGITEVASNHAADGVVTKEYAVIGAEGAITLRLDTLNSTDSAGSGDSFDPSIELWIDPIHMRAFDQDPKKIFHDFYVQRLSDLTPGHLRTSSTWSRALYASSSLLDGGSGANRNAYDPIAQPRLTPSAPRYSGALPVPWEAHAWIANEVGTDLWVGIPFTYYAQGTDPRRDAAEAYIKDMARTLRDELSPELTCIVEFSNEMWNSNFGTYSVLNALEGPMRPELMARFVLDAFTWWSEEWNDARVEFVCMGFGGDSNWVTAQTDVLKASGLVDAVGCGGYYFPRASESDLWGEDNPALCASFDNQDPNLELQAAASMFLTINNNVRFDAGRLQPGTTHALRIHGDVALDLEEELGRTIGLYVYEGGPSLLSNCQKLRTLYGEFQQNSRFSFLLLYYEMLRLIDGFRTGPESLELPLRKHVSRFSYFAFCQPQSPQYGDWLLLTDLYAGIPGLAEVDTQVQWKYQAIRLFNALH